MPYIGEFANKASHADLLNSPRIRAFLEQCTYLRMPSDEEGRNFAARFEEVPDLSGVGLPNSVVAIDGSRHESMISDQIPSTSFGFAKVSAMLIVMEVFRSLRVLNDQFVDPFRVARLQDSNDALTFFVPSSNTRWNGRASVKDSFRAAVDAQLYEQRLNNTDPSSSLRATLFYLASLRTGDLATGDPNRLYLHRCPSCGQERVEVFDQPEPQYCNNCYEEIFPTDCLRIWEEVAENQSNVTALTRLMSTIEHLLLIHYIRYLADRSLTVLANTAFFIDGPLAVFSNSAWLHAPMMACLSRINARLQARQLPTLLIIGLQKTGQVVDHVGLISKYISKNRIFAIDDEYRYEFILSPREPSFRGFGDETYYGQDFVYRTSQGRTFVFGLPYPFATKRPEGINFVEAKATIGNYQELPRALKLISNFESDLYQNAVIPIALAHRYTAISLVPGGQVLDRLTRQALSSNG